MRAVLLHRPVKFLSLIWEKTEGPFARLRNRKKKNTNHEDKNIGFFFPNIVDVEVLPPLQPRLTDRSWGMTFGYSQVELPSRRSQHPCVPSSEQPEPRHGIPSWLRLLCPQINVPGKMHWGRGAALCQRSTQYLQALGKLDKPCLFSPPRLFPNCLCEGQSQHQQSGQGQMALVSWPGAGQPRRPWMGQLSCPRSQGRMMAGQAPPPQRVLVIGRGTQDEKEKESKGRQVTTDGAAAGVTWRREAEAVHTPNTSKSSSCWGQGSCACTGGCVEALQEHCVSYYQSSLWGGTGRGRFGWPAGLSFGTPLTVKKQTFGLDSGQRAALTWLPPISHLRARKNTSAAVQVWSSWQKHHGGLLGILCGCSSIGKQHNPLCARSFDTGIHQGVIFTVFNISAMIESINDWHRCRLILWQHV